VAIKVCTTSCDGVYTTLGLVISRAFYPQAAVCVDFLAVAA